MAPASTPNAFPSNDAFNILIRINVGKAPDQRTFDVCKGVLCFYSGYFDTMLRSRYREACEHMANLSSEDPKIFDMFQHWIHTRCLFESTLDPISLLDFQLLSELWVFGDAHDVPMFQNFIIDLILRKIKETETIPAAETIQYIYKNTVSTARLRCLMQEFLFNVTGVSWNLDDPDDLPLSAYKSIGKDELRKKVQKTHDYMQPLPQPPPLRRTKPAFYYSDAAAAFRESQIDYWCPQDRTDFVEYLRYYGRNFGAISTHLGTKTASEVYEHYQRLVSGGKEPGIKEAANEADKRRASARAPCYWHVHKNGRSCFEENEALLWEEDLLEKGDLFEEEYLD